MVEEAEIHTEQIPKALWIIKYRRVGSLLITFWRKALFIFRATCLLANIFIMDLDMIKFLLAVCVILFIQATQRRRFLRKMPIEIAPDWINIKMERKYFLLYFL